MIQKSFKTDRGNIVYWTNQHESGRANLVFLPGLTADHRLFDMQIEAFKDKYNVFVWDAPGHAASKDFELTFTLDEKAMYLKQILDAEKIESPVLIGQSMGGYVSQAFIQIYPGAASGFISIDSAPLKRKYVTAAEIWLLKRMEPVYRMFPWKLLKKWGSNGVATTEYGRKLMLEMMRTYDDDKKHYCRLSGHGFILLAEAMEKNLPYEINCPVLLICGEKDNAGSAKSYNRRWAKGENIPIAWIKDAGHNANTDKPEEINQLIETFIEENLKY